MPIENRDNKGGHHVETEAEIAVIVSRPQISQTVSSHQKPGRSKQEFPGYAITLILGLKPPEQ